MSTQFWVAVAGWIIIGIFCILFRRSLKRLHDKPPQAVVSLLKELPDDWKLESYAWRGDLEWEAVIAVADRRFKLFDDQGRICVLQLIDGHWQLLRGKGYLEDTLIPKTLAERLVEASTL